MINQLIEATLQCPYCWEQITVLIDASVEMQEYTEDCEVCCRPIEFVVEVDELDQVKGIAHLQNE